MRGLPPIALRHSLVVLALVSALTPTVRAQQPQQVIADPNVNMVKGTVLPVGDPYLQRQNEPSIAVSTRNPCHLVAGANDYRAVDVPFDDTVPPNTENNLSLAGDAWLGLFKSFDCGAKWQSTLLPGYPQDSSNVAAELKGHAAGADPTVRAGTNGLFYYSGMVFNRGDQGTSKIFVARLIDNNNKERGDPIQFLDVSIVDTGTKGQFLDKPWMAVDVPRTGYGPGSQLGGSATCSVNGQTLPAGNVYMAWAKFTGNGHQHSKLMFARSTDCGRTFKQHPITNRQTLSQGANIAIAPHDGTIYLTWREFASTNNNNRTVNFWITTSSDGGESWTAAKIIGSNVQPFDQLRSTTTFRSNALPAITADHEGRVYVAWSARGYATYLNAGNLPVSSDDARIVMVASSDRGKTWTLPFPIDPYAGRGHQLMPSLTYASGKLQAIWYDAREDVSGVWGRYIDDSQTKTLLHTVDIRGAQATPAPLPVFVADQAMSLEISKYRTWNLEIKDAAGNVTGYNSVEIGSNPPNLPMYANGTTPFIGDYIDISGLPSFPVQSSSGQVWQPNVGPRNMIGAAATNLSTAGFPTLPVFHATWTDNRDVQVQQCLAEPQLVGQRNANIYTARLTPGLYVGSPGNTKPFGYRLNPKTGAQELIQRGFVVFAQNTTNELKYFRFKIETQPQGGRASLRQFDNNGPLTEVTVAIPAVSTVARTVYATSTDVNAQLLINVEEMDHDGGTVVDQNGASTKVFAWFVKPAGLKGSVLLNPDRTNPPILDPDVDSEIPQIAQHEAHDPSMFDAQFFKRRTRSRQLDVLNARIPDPENPDPENPDPENPDPENPDPENPDPENPDPENPDPENPDPENPDPENPDPENPDPENSLLENSAISDSELQNATITDIQWRVHNSGNTTSAYKFRPSLPKIYSDQKYQLIVTRRSAALTLGPDCKPVYKSANQVLVNIQSFQPKTPDPENPDPENPDPENPDPENPDPENANFFLAPDETATVTLRVFDTNPDNDIEIPPPSKREHVVAKTAAQAANTGETTVATAVAGPDLTLREDPSSIGPAIVRPGRNASVTFTLRNRGTGAAYGPAYAPIETRVYRSTDAILNAGDVLVATINEPTPAPAGEDPRGFAACTGSNEAECSTTSTVAVPMPEAPGTYYVIVVTDEIDAVFEADELNNQLTLSTVVQNYQLAFTTQPTSTTQDFVVTPAVQVALSHPDLQPVTALDVATVSISIQNNPGDGDLSGTTVRPNVGGVATFDDLRIDNVGTGYTLTAAAPLANSAFSAAFNIEADLAPVVANDTYTTGEDQPATIAAPGVLMNDSDPPTKGTKPAGYVFDAAKESDPSNGTVSVNADGSFVYTPNAAFNGTDSFTYRARDGRPGNATLATVTVNVTSINDAPSFTAGANQVSTEDAGPQTVPAWATAISAGPANESSQAVDFIVTTDNAALFAAAPAIASDGTLTYTAAPDKNGVANVTVRIHDSGGAANGGVDTSAPQTFTITISGINDPPAATADAYSTNEDTTVGRDAVGDPDALLDNDSDADGDGLIAEYLALPTNGTLSPHQNGSFSYAPNANFFGVDSFTYRAFDGTTTGNTVTVTITVASVNDAPAFTAGPNQSVTVNSGAKTVANWATGITTGAANEAGQALDFIVTSSNPAIFSVAPAISAAGALTFTPSATATGTSTITVRLHDNGGTANGGVDTSAPQTFTISVTDAPTTFVVTNTNDSGAGSLREAITNANANASADTITFNIPGVGVRTIAPATPLPSIVFPVTIDATTQPGFAASPLIELSGASAGANASGLVIDATNVTIRGFVINRFTANGIAVWKSGATIAGNYIGTNAAGDAAMANNYGIGIAASPVTVGGTTPADRNVISGNTVNGVQVQSVTTAGVVITGNYVGTDASGAVAVGNSGHGVWVAAAGRVQVGGDNPGEGNLISGNRFSGVQIYLCAAPQPCAGHVVAGNRIGTNAAGTAAVGNLERGIEIYRSPKNIIRGNLISGNGGSPAPLGMSGSAIVIFGEDVATNPQSELHYGDQLIVGNKIGTDINGTSGIPNLGFGVVLSYNVKTTIGGPNALDRNIIAYNAQAGVHVGYARSDNNVIEGNYIGVNANQQAAGNQVGGGIYITNSSSLNTVRGNVISANSNGVVMQYGQHDQNIITGNFIGTDTTGTANLGNTQHGVTVAGKNNLVSQNRIANNGGWGVAVVVDGGTPVGDPTGNRISQNTIYNNGQVGIDLTPIVSGTQVYGVTANDAGDADAGPNNLQNFPVVTGAIVNGASTTITGTLNGAANATYTIELFKNDAADPTGYGEGQAYLTSLAVTTDGAGNASFNTTVASALAGFVTATATSTGNDTSEFSLARGVVVNNPPTSTADQVLTVSDYPMTTNPAANDVDPDVASPSVRTTYAAFGGPTAPLTSPGDVAVVSSTGKAYFTGGNLSSGTEGRVGVLDLATNTVSSTIPMRGNFGALFAETNTATDIVYFRGGINLLAVDGRSASPTFNQIILNINVGTIQSWALDSVHHRLYLTTTTSGTGLISNGRLTVLDIDPSSPTFHQVIGEVTVPGSNASVGAIGVNPATNKVYIAVSGGAAGIYVVNPATLTMALVGNNTTSFVSSIAVNDADNMIYAAGGSQLHPIDGATDMRLAAITLPAPVTGSTDSRIVIHRGTGRVFVRTGGFPNTSNLTVVDGKPGSVTFNGTVTTINLGRENGTAFMGIDEAIDRLIATSPSDLRSHVINTNTNTIVSTITATQALSRVSIDTATHRAYLSGATGYIKVIDLTTAAPVTEIHVGTEVFSVAVDPLSHTAYVSETGLTTAVKRLSDTGIVGAIALPHGDGREQYAIRNSVTNKIYVLNGGATFNGGSDALPGFVHVIDGGTNTVTASVPVGPVPFGMAVDEANNKIFVGNGSQGSSFPGGISIIDGVTHAVTQANMSAIPALNPASGVSVGRDMVVTGTGRLYFRITNGATSQLLGVLDGNVASLVNLGSVNVNIVRYNPVADRLYVGVTQIGSSVNQIHVIDPSTNNIVTTLAVGSPTNFITNQSYIAVNSVTNRVFIADFNDDKLTVVNGATNAVIATIAMPFGPSTVAVDQVMNRVYVGNATARSLTIIDGASLRVVRSLALPIAPVMLAVDSSLSPARIYAVSTANEGAVSVIDDPGTAAPQITSVTQGSHGSVVLNADGSVTYTPNAGYFGNDSYTYTTTDGDGGSTTSTANVVVYQELAFQPATLPAGVVGQAYSQQLTTTGGSGSPISWSIFGFAPGGLHLSSTGLLSGTLQQSGTFTFTVTARDLGQELLSDTQTYTIVVGPPVLAPASLPTATVNAPYTAQVFAGGATGSVTWSLNTNGHPGLNWLQLSSDGVLSGTPSVYGTTPSFTVTATDSAVPAQTASRTYTISVGGPLSMTALRDGIVLEAPSAISFVGGSGGTRTATLVAGSLPPGLTLNTNGTWAGTPLRHGTYNFTLELKDCQSGSCATPQVVQKNIAWVVSAKDQQGNSGSGAALPFGGPGGRKIAQVFTVGAHGLLTGVSLANVSCTATQTPLTIEIQRLTPQGLPDDTAIATGTAILNHTVIGVAPQMSVAIGERLALVVSSPLACSFANPLTTSDGYNGGDAYVSDGGPWTSLFASDARYDIPSFRTLIHPATPVTYLRGSRNSATATLLMSATNNGKVLHVGGASASELYDPAAPPEQLTASSGTLLTQRSGHTETMLSDGTVLIAGGRDNSSLKLATAEIYNPATGTFTATAGSMTNARDNHRAVRVMIGGLEKVFMFGGLTAGNSTLNSVEIYDVATQTFSSGGTMLLARQVHAAVLLNTGKILVAGGYTFGSGPTAELYDPATQSSTATNGPMVLANRGNLAAVALANNNVLLTGGQSGDIRAEAEIYDVASGTFTATGAPMASPRMWHTATLLADGSVLISGGVAEQPLNSYTLPLATMERYIPATNSFVNAGGMAARRERHSATLLPDGRVLIAGGSSQSWMSANSAEIFDPVQTPNITPTTLANGTPGVAYAPVTFNGNGGTAPYAITLAGGQLPAGMSFDGPTRTLSGTPTTAGISRFALAVTDSNGRDNLQSLSLQIGNVNTITSPYRLTDAPVNNAYNVQLTATGAGNTWSMLPGSGNALPVGITLSAGGLLSGTPTATGYYNFGVRAIDNQGVEATKVLSISVTSPLVITTTNIGFGELFGIGLNCMSANGGIGSRTWSISGGALPPGLNINSANGCFNGSITALGNYNFTVRVTDQASIPQSVTQNYGTTVLAQDQSSSTGAGANLNFGSGTGVRLAERVTTGITGTLRAVRFHSVTCNTAGTQILYEIQGLDAAGRPNGQTLATGTATTTSTTAALNVALPFAADAPFAVVIDAAAQCAVKPQSFDSYPGDAFISSGGGQWQRLQESADGRYDFGLTTLVEPEPGLLISSQSRGNHTGTLLGDGKVLIAGGHFSQPSAELFDPPSNTLTSTPPMTAARQSHAAVRLNDGRVLVTGGYVNGIPVATAEIYDPANGQWSATTGAMTAARSSHAMVTLSGGNVLITGGNGATGFALNSAELFDPITGTFTALANMNQFRTEHTATLLNSGKVLIANGYATGNNAELYDELAQTFTTVASGPLTWRGRHTATLLGNGTVLIAGGTGGNANEALSSAEIYDPNVGATGSFTAAGDMITPRQDHAATLLSDGSVLITGGLISHIYPQSPVATMERYVPGTGFVSAGTMLASRYAHTVTALAGGRALIAGTFGWSSAAQRTAELFDAAVPYLATAQLPDGSSGGAYSATLQAAGGAGGYTITLIAGTLPAGLTYSAGSFEISGNVAAAQAGTYSLTFRVTDALGRASNHLRTLRIDPVVITTASLPTAYQGVAYSTALSATATSGVTWSVISGTLPGGLSLNTATGAITGTPTASCCITSFTVKATDAIGQSAIKPLFIRVELPMTIGTTSLGDGYAGNTYYGALWRNGGTDPVSWSLTGNVPMGLTVNASTGWFNTSYPADVLRQGGVFSFTANVSDSSAPQQSDSQNLTLRVFADEQTIGSSVIADVPLPATRRVAQVMRAATDFDLQGVRAWGMKCDAGVSVTVGIYGVTAGNEPDTTGAALASGSITSNTSGFFNNYDVIFPSPVSLARGEQYAVVFSSGGACNVVNWSNSDYYSAGDAWVSDSGGAWTAAVTAVGRADVPLTTIVYPAPSMRFLAGYRGGLFSATLGNGKVFMGGGELSTEIYDPQAGSFTLGPNMSHDRHQATATVLASGKVLVVGGEFYNTTTNLWEGAVTTQLYNPATNAFEASQNMTVGRFRHTATRLQDGSVLIAGGQSYLANGNSSSPATADLFDGSGNYVATYNMTGGRVEHSATLLADGRVLIMGGWSWGNGPATVAEIFDPATGTFAGVNGGSINWPSSHSATLITAGPDAGKVLIAGGHGAYPDAAPNYIFDPLTNSFSNAPAMVTPRIDHTAVTLANGRIVFSGGYTESQTWATTASVEMFDPVTGQFTALGETYLERTNHTINVVTIGDDTWLLIAGGWGSAAMTNRSMELFDVSGALGTFAAAPSMATARRSHVAVQLDNGTVLLAGSDQLNVVSAEIYNPATNSTSATGSLGTARCYGCAYAKLPDGKVLVTGGWNGGPVFTSAELYNPATGTFTATTGSMSVPRVEHSAVLLDNGKVLILGGYDGTTPHASAELYDPATQTFTGTGSMSAARYRATVVKLADGRVLVTGGLYGATGDTVVQTAEIYNPVNGTFSGLDGMVTPRLTTAVLLDDGRVLFAGGWDGTSYLQTAEIYSPLSNSFSAVGSMTSIRTGHFAVKLESGAVVIGGGHDGNVNLDTAEIFNAYTNSFTRISNLPAARSNATAFRLDDGRIMITGGVDSGGFSSRVDYYQP